jgi:hypothetical protein
MVRKVCCDPLKKHTSKIIEALIPVPKTLYKYFHMEKMPVMALAALSKEQWHWPA